jgi:hypothetical protein
MSHVRVAVDRVLSALPAGADVELDAVLRELGVQRLEDADLSDTVTMANALRAAGFAPVEGVRSPMGLQVWRRRST